MVQFLSTQKSFFGHQLLHIYPQLTGDRKEEEQSSRSRSSTTQLLRSKHTTIVGRPHPPLALLGVGSPRNPASWSAMDGGSARDQYPPRLLDLIPKERRWWKAEESSGGVTAEESQLELRLWPTDGNGKEHHPLVLSLGLPNKKPCAGAKRGFLELDSTAGDSYKGFRKQVQQQKGGGGGFRHYKADGMVAEEQQYQQLSHDGMAAATAIAAVAHDKLQSRNTMTPVVGWPPVRSYRKNIASATKSPPVSGGNEPKKPEKVECPTRGLFLKINMDGIPIGRKIDLKAYRSYERLSAAVDELFRGLLAAQREPHIGNEGGSKESPAITGLLDGSGEYTLVYEDSDGDRILVGDVPWEMFVSTAKRLRVLKTSQLSALSVRYHHPL